MASAVNNPHGTFFRACVSKPAIAKDLVKSQLPPDMVERINWDSLELTDKSYVEDTLAHAHTDVIYKCFLKNQDQYTYLYMLLDNDRTPTELLASRMQAYNLTLIAEHMAEGHTYIPLVLNVCIKM